MKAIDLLVDGAAFDILSEYALSRSIHVIDGK